MSAPFVGDFPLSGQSYLGFSSKSSLSLELIYGKESFFQRPLNTGKSFSEQAFWRLHPRQPKFSSQEFEFRDCLENVTVSFSVHRGWPQALDPLQICSRLLQAI